MSRESEVEGQEEGQGLGGTQSVPGVGRNFARRQANHTLVSALLALWDMVPEQRFGQFVMNLSREPEGFADTWEWKHGAWFERIGAMYAEIMESRDANPRP